MKTHTFVHSDPMQFDSNCSVCGGKRRDSIHGGGIVLVRVADLIGKDLTTLTVDIRSRTATGELMYDHTADQPTDHTRTRLLRVFTHKDKRGTWMRWEWEKTTRPHDCGYSEIVMDGEHELVYHLAADDGEYFAAARQAIENLDLARILAP